MPTKFELCEHHTDSGLRTTNPHIDCVACRREGHFTQIEIEEWDFHNNFIPTYHSDIDPEDDKDQEVCDYANSWEEDEFGNVTFNQEAYDSYRESYRKNYLR